MKEVGAVHTTRLKLRGKKEREQAAFWLSSDRDILSKRSEKQVEISEYYVGKLQSTVFSIKQITF